MLSYRNPSKKEDELATIAQMTVQKLDAIIAVCWITVVGM